MVGGIMPVQVTSRLLVGFTVVMAMAMLSKFMIHEHCVPGGFRSRDHQRVVGGG